MLAENIVSVMGGGATKPFVYKTLGTLAALGHFKGVGKVMKLKIYGLIAWWVWRTYYLLQMPRWERRLRIVLDWTIALFFRNDIVKLDLFGEAHPLHADQKQPSQNGPTRVEMINRTEPAGRCGSGCMRFKDKVCIVTGGGSGIGRATCEQMPPKGDRRHR